MSILALLLVLTAGIACSDGAEDKSASTSPGTAASPDQATFPVTVTDAIGKQYTFDAPPKIGCLWAGCTEMMADLGVVPHAVGGAPVQNAFNFPSGVPAMLVADTSNPEQWAAAGVDIIVHRVPASPANENLALAAPVFYMHHPSYGESSQSGYDAYVENLRIFGAITGKPAEADAAIERWEMTLANLKKLSTPQLAQLKVAVLFPGDNYLTVGPGNPFCEALSSVGLGRCIGEGATSTEINPEAFLSANPDWIVYQSGSNSSKDRNDPVWSRLNAVTQGHIYDAQGNRYYCCSLRGLIHALQEYAHYVVPSAGIPLPGPQADFDPRNSPLVKN